MLKFLTLIRWKNLVMIAFVQILVKYALFPAFNASISLNALGFGLLVLSTLCIAAGGYIINDIYDIETDLVNKPNRVIVGKSISESTANTLYLIFTFVGVILGFYLSHTVDRAPFFTLFVIISALLYVYASHLKQMAIAGNIVISVLVALSVLLVGIFELIPAITAINQDLQSKMFEVLVDYAVFAFLINFIREIVKDIQDVDGDYKAGMKTLAILIGKNRASKIALGFTIFSLALIIYYVASFIFMHPAAVIYFLVAVVGPLIYIAIKLISAEKNSHFKHISLMLKIVMITGMLSMLFFHLMFNMKQAL